MTTELQRELSDAIESGVPLDEIVILLRRYKQLGIAQRDVYSFLEGMHQAASDLGTDDRILEVADFVAGFCAPHMKIWDGQIPSAV